jgi:hypothetical protein
MLLFDAMQAIKLFSTIRTPSMSFDSASPSSTSLHSSYMERPTKTNQRKTHIQKLSH